MEAMVKNWWRTATADEVQTLLDIFPNENGGGSDMPVLPFLLVPRQSRPVSGSHPPRQSAYPVAVVSHGRTLSSYCSLLFWIRMLDTAWGPRLSKAKVGPVKGD